MVSFVSAVRSVFGFAAMAAALSSSAAAQQTHAPEPEPVVKFIYFVPSNIAFNETSYATVQKIAADFAQLNKLNFDGRAPNYKVDYVLGDHTWEWYVYNREEDNRIIPWEMKEHRWHIASDLTHYEIKRKLGDSVKDRNLKHIIFLHEHAASEDTSETASEADGAVYMAYEDIVLARQEPTKPVLILAHEAGHMWGLDDDGEYVGDCMRYGFNNLNNTCDSPINKAKVLLKHNEFFTAKGENRGVRPAPPACMAKIGDKCTGSNGVRSCCSPEGYCQPVSSTEYQCMKRPLMCSDQLTDIDYYGNDLKEFMNVATPEDCCTLCSNEAGCRAYTYLFAGAPGINPGSCYLKKLAGEPTKSIGAVSGVILEDWSTGPCTAKKGDLCMKNAVNIRGCCPTGTYCMPWSPTEYRCEDIPRQCGVQLMDTSYSMYAGHHIATVNTSSPDQCCETCSQTDGCKAYTYHASAKFGSSPAGSCLLKSDDQIAAFTLFGAISGSAIKPETCENGFGDSCTENPCCPSNGFCQPVGASANKCAEKPAQCPVQQLNVDYSGGDVQTVKATSSEQCCEACSLNKDCNAYTYYQYTVPGRTSGDCYLKKTNGDQTSHVVGAVSALLADRLGCQGKIGGACGFGSCCPTGAYCQPQPGGTNQCLTKPAMCGVQLPNIEYTGTAISTLTDVASADKCCDACSQNPKCNAYSFYLFATGNRKAGTCYLKSTAGATTVSIGAVSGSKIERPTGCQGVIGGACGYDSCCPSDGFCQPLVGGKNQCVKKPAQCAIQVLDVDYVGYDLKMETVKSADQCCDACSQHPDCDAYSYYNFTTEGRGTGACYLKKSTAGGTSTVVGAVSGSMVTRSACQGKIGGACGFDSCCPHGGYCQPLAGGSNKCLARPAMCGVQLPNVEYSGTAIATLTAVASADKCCDACSQNPKCNAYSFYLFATGNRKAGTCYLKSTAGATTTSIGAVSGSKIERPTGCQGVIGGACGYDSCCPDGGFCQPLAGGKNQCVKKPAQCAVQVANVDYVGNDIKTVKAKSADLCCDACSANADCNAYSFYLFSTEGREAGVCYLKTAAGYTSQVVGAVSGSVVSRRDCKGKLNEACGVGSCCPSDAYCQPLTSRTNKCLKKPAQCGVHLANLDFIGNDVGTVTVSSASECCKACSENGDCNVYSYYLFASEGRPARACYLKSAAGDTTPVTGVVSGSMITRS